MPDSDARQVSIVEVSPRDGLQNEAGLVSTQDKLELINRAITAGVRRIEVVSFVHPKIVPQMADAEMVCAGLPERDDVEYIGLVLNSRGLDRAVQSGVIDEVGCVAVASDAFGLRNQRQTREQSIEVCNRLIRRARENGLSAQVTLSVAFGCPFEGEVERNTVIDAAQRLAESGPREIALADTIGVASPIQVEETFAAVRAALGPDVPLRAHFHNTRNLGFANAYGAIRAGVTTIDASIGGIGGCPFAPRATGNIATEDLQFMLERMGVQSGLNLDQVINAAGWLGSVLNRPVPGFLSRAGTFPE
ncbi:MAG: hydroxymethylglutaryl-CoA lyase [Xanthomonadales bacterium]|nr:hydroxymethylglutaryl-CoA lyase [Xanthomonadales bacterium]